LIDIPVQFTIAIQNFGGAMGKQKSREFYSAVDQITDKEAFLESVREGFRDIKDPRAEDNQGYRLVDLLIIIICAILAGANTITDIHAYAQVKIGMFQQFLQMNTMPSYDVFWWLLTRLDPKQIEDCFVRWIQSLPNKDKEQLIAIDGKYLRGASRRGKRIHLVSAWDSNRSLLLGQVKAHEKSNEITAIPELLDNLDLINAIVTIDAAGCQTEITSKIIDRGGDYVIALKGNQGTLHAEADNFFTQAKDVGYENADCKTSISCEKGHGRLEERVVAVTNQLDWLDCRDEWKDLKSLIEVTSRRTIKDKITEERRFYISSLELTPERAGAIVRGHWTIENRLHWNMDVNFCEDASLAAIGNAAENLAALKRLASTMIRIDLGGVRGTAQRRRQAAWDDSWTLRLLSRIFEVKM
jgi:predicted transposase YbfD/YdcC